MGAHPADDLDPRVSDLIRLKARKLTGHYGFRRQDQEDLQQELALHVFVGLKKHDPSRSSVPTFADRMIASKIKDIIRHGTAQKRDRSRQQPLEDMEAAAAEEDKMILALDVEDAVAQLPVELRPFAGQFMEHGSVAGVVKATGMTRQQVRTAQQKIAEHLRSAGLAE